MPYGPYIEHYNNNNNNNNNNNVDIHFPVNNASNVISLNESMSGC